MVQPRERRPPPRQHVPASFHNHRIAAIDLAKPPTNLTEQVAITDAEPFVIHPGEFVLGRTLEWVELPDDVVARIEGKSSSLGRLGLIVHATAGFVDPGWKGTLTLEITNLTRVPIKLWAGKPIAQLSLHDARRAGAAARTAIPSSAATTTARSRRPSRATKAVRARRSPEPAARSRMIRVRCDKVAPAMDLALIIAAAEHAASAAAEHEEHKSEMPFFVAGALFARVRDPHQRLRLQAAGLPGDRGPGARRHVGRRSAHDGGGRYRHLCRALTTTATPSPTRCSSRAPRSSHPTARRSAPFARCSRTSPSTSSTAS